MEIIVVLETHRYVILVRMLVEQCKNVATYLVPSCYRFSRVVKRKKKYDVFFLSTHCCRAVNERVSSIFLLRASPRHKTSWVVKYAEGRKSINYQTKRGLTEEDIKNHLKAF